MFPMIETEDDIVNERTNSNSSPDKRSLRKSTDGSEKVRASLLRKNARLSITLDKIHHDDTVANRYATELRLQEEARAVAEAEKRRLLQIEAESRIRNDPIPSFVIKSVCSASSNIFINICGHMDVTDAISHQGITGAPFMICHKAHSSSVDNEEMCTTHASIAIYDVVVHMKYIYSSLDIIAGEQPLKHKLAVCALKMLNKQFYSEDAGINIQGYSFLETLGNYKGTDVEPFSLPIGMPVHVSFDSLAVTPTPGVSLICKSLKARKNVCINVCHHEDAPKYPLAKCHMLVGNASERGEQQDESILIYDVVLHTSLWSTTNEAKNLERVLLKVLTEIEVVLGDVLEKKYEYSKSNYEGDFVACCIISGVEIGMVTLPKLAFVDDSPVVKKVPKVLAMVKKMEATHSSSKVSDILASRPLVRSKLEKTPPCSIRAASEASQTESGSSGCHLSESSALQTVSPVALVSVDKLNKKEEKIKSVVLDEEVSPVALVSVDKLNKKEEKMKSVVLDEKVSPVALVSVEFLDGANADMVRIRLEEEAILAGDDEKRRKKAEIDIRIEQEEKDMRLRENLDGANADMVRIRLEEEAILAGDDEKRRIKAEIDIRIEQEEKDMRLREDYADEMAGRAMENECAVQTRESEAEAAPPLSVFTYFSSFF